MPASLSSDGAFSEDGKESTTSALAGLPRGSGARTVDSTELMALKKLEGLKKVHAIISKGEFTTVYRCSVDGIGEVTVKLFTLGVRFREVLHDIKEIKHPNLIQVFQINNVEPISVVLESCACTLHDALHGSCGLDKSAVSNPEQRLHTAADLFNAVDFLHARDIMHRDISSTTCFINWGAQSTMSLKLGEFTKATSVIPAMVMTMWTGSICYMAPEVTDDENYGYPADIYSCAILTHEILCRKLPYGDSQSPLIVLQVMRGVRPDVGEFPTLANNDASFKRRQMQRFVRACWAGEPAERLTGAQAAAFFESLLGAEGH